MDLGIGNTLFHVAASTLRVSTPLLLAALGGLISERSGVTNIALEGLMLVGAFSSAVVAYYAHSTVLGVFAGMMAGAALAAVYGIVVIRLRANQIVAGTAINMLAFGMVPFLSKIICGSTGSTPQIPLAERFTLAPMFWAFGLVFLIHFWMRFTLSGLWIGFAGENPEALNSAGIRVNRVRWSAVLLSGMLAGLGGMSLSVFLSSSYSRNMTAGRGFMALAAVVFGKWRPIPTLVACLLFGFVDALQIRLQGVILWGTQPVPVQWIQILPYCVTVLVLAGVVGQSRAPRALGLPFERA